MAARKKRKKPFSPTARALKECRKRGWIAQVVEQTIPHVFIKRDLFGCIDIVAITPDGIMGIQATGGQGGAHAQRVNKIKAEPRARQWIEAGCRLEVWSYALRGSAAARKTYELRVEPIRAEDITCATKQSTHFCEVSP